MSTSLKFKSGDKVIVIAGKYKGIKSTIVKVMPSKGKIVVEGVALFKKRIKPNKNSPQGKIVEVEYPIHYSNVLHLDPKASIPTRIGYKVVDGKKVRYAKKSGELIDLL